MRTLEMIFRDRLTVVGYERQDSDGIEDLYAAWVGDEEPASFWIPRDLDGVRLEAHIKCGIWEYFGEEY